METESGSVVPGAGAGASVSGGRCQRQRLCNSVQGQVLDATELGAYKWYVLRHVSFATEKLETEMNEALIHATARMSPRMLFCAGPCQRGGSRGQTGGRRGWGRVGRDR